LCVGVQGFTTVTVKNPMPSEMRRRMALVGTDVSEKHVSSIIRVEGISDLGRTLAVTSNWSSLLVAPKVVPSALILSTLMMEAIRFSETSVRTRVTWRHIPEGCNIQY
jgi:hypothetical protein